MRKLFIATGLVAALALPAGVAVAQEGDVPAPEPTCQHDGALRLHEGPRDGTGNQYQRADHARHEEARGAGGFGQGVQDGSGPIHEGPADGTGNQYGRDAE